MAPAMITVASDEDAVGHAHAAVASRIAERPGDLRDRVARGRDVELELAAEEAFRD